MPDPLKTSLRILCVDDNQDACELLSIILGAEGYQVETTKSVADALRLAHSRKYDLYIFDSWLPDGSGLELCRQIRVQDHNTPIVFYSAAVYPQDQQKAMEAGAQAYITKPDTSLELTPTVERLLNLTGKHLPATSKARESKSKQVFQIAYDAKLLTIRTALLTSRGYEVSSAFGNEEAKRLLDQSQNYLLFIVGHAASKAIREEMVTWLKTHFPGTKILALNPPTDTKLPGADYNFIQNGADVWLATVTKIAS
jgi:CheY-like chemotaxis protein